LGTAIKIQFLDAQLASFLDGRLKEPHLLLLPSIMPPFISKCQLHGVNEIIIR